MSRINIVLHEPEIPQNTGNIARTCAVTGCALHLIEPLGFTVTDRSLKRAGLDYWKELDITYYRDLDDFFARNPDGKYFFFTTKAKRSYTDADYSVPRLRQGDERASGLSYPRTVRRMRAAADERDAQEPEPVQLGGRRSVRGASAVLVRGAGMTVKGPGGKKV